MTNMMFGRMSSDGTLKMLATWRDATRVKDQRPQLKKALEDTGFDSIAEEYFGHPDGEEPKAKRAKQNNPEAEEKHQDESNEEEKVLPDGKGSYLDHAVIAAKPTDDQLNTAKCYDMARRKKGIAFILNNFSEERKGSKIDAMNITHVLEEIGYESVNEKDLESTEINRCLDDLIRNKIKKDHTSVVLVLMSHGTKAGIDGTDNEIVSLEDIKQKFYASSCPALQDKPKIIFVQACRGGKLTYAVKDGIALASEESSGQTNKPVTSQVEGSGDNPFEKKEPRPVVKMVTTDFSTPDNADIFVANATCEGHYAYRIPEGSWFIQALCEVMLAKVHLIHFDAIIREVSKRVMKLVGKVDGRDKLSHQTPEFSKQGDSKDIFFLPKYP